MPSLRQARIFAKSLDLVRLFGTAPCAATSPCAQTTGLEILERLAAGVCFETLLGFAEIAQGAFREAGRFAYHQVSVDLVTSLGLPAFFHVGAQRRHCRTSQLET